MSAFTFMGSLFWDNKATRFVELRGIGSLLVRERGNTVPEPSTTSMLAIALLATGGSLLAGRLRSKVK